MHFISRNKINISFDESNFTREFQMQNLKKNFNGQKFKDDYKVLENHK